MKITKSKLKRIIKEEIENVLSATRRKKVPWRCTDADHKMYHQQEQYKIISSICHDNCDDKKTGEESTNCINYCKEDMLYALDDYFEKQPGQRCDPRFYVPAIENIYAGTGYGPECREWHRDYDPDDASGCEA